MISSLLSQHKTLSAAILELYQRLLNQCSTFFIILGTVSKTSKSMLNILYHSTKPFLNTLPMSFSLSNLKASVVVTSDTCSRDPSQDTSGDYVVKQLESMKFKLINKYIVADEEEDITKVVRRTVDDQENALTITVGGTGLCPRDVTPEATSVLYDKSCLGIAVALHMASLRYTPKAALSRLTAGISKSCLIINFPGKQRACKDCFSCLIGFLDHALEQIRYNPIAIELTHKLDSITDNEITRKVANLDLMEKCQSLVEKLDGGMSHQEVAPGSVTSTSEDVILKSTELTMKEGELSVQKANLIKPARKLCQTQSQYPLINYDEALDIMSNLMHELQLKTIQIPLHSTKDAHQSLGLMLAKDLYSKRIIPIHQASTMDGYLLNVPDNMLNKLHIIRTLQAIYLDDFASFQEAQLNPSMRNKFFCCQINTGGSVPTPVEDCHIAVVPFENTSSNPNLKTISISNIQMNKFIRAIGSDLNQRDCLRAGTLIGAPELAIILSMGYSTIEVVEKPTIGVFSSGDELVGPFNNLDEDPNRVMDVNSPLLASLYESRGFRAISFGILKDDPVDILKKITTSLKKCDILVITGGASMGTGDHMKNVILDLGGIIHFGRVNIKPGKPAAFTSVVMDGVVRKFVFCLPGNPVSAYITSLILVLPFLEEGIRNHLGHFSSGISLHSLGELVEVQLASITDALVDGSGDSREYVFDGRLEFVRATRVKSETRDMKAPPQVSISIKQQSSRLLSLKDCDWLIVIEPSLKGSKFLVGQLYHALLLTKNY